MALKATIFKADLQIANLDRHYYGDHALTLARHPSETDERMMMRLLAFALHADAALAFGKGLSAEDEPDLWNKDLTGAIRLWIEVGQPDPKRILKACNRSEAVAVYSYGGAARVWWQQAADTLAKARNLQVWSVAPDASRALAELAQRTMQLQCTIQEEQVWIVGGGRSVQLEPARLSG